MPKRPLTSKSDIIHTGFLARHGGGSIDEFGESESDLDLNSNGEYQDPTICLTLLQTMITTVLESDAHLFTPAEVNVLVSFLHLSIHAQHLFVYLAIHPKWHRLEHLNNVEIPSGDMLCTIVELCRPIYNHFAVADCPAEAKSESPDVCVKAEQSSPVLLKGELPSETKFETKPDHFSGSLPRPSNADIKLTPSQPNSTAGPSTLFPFPRPQPNPSSLCISDAELTLRQLLEYMDPKELNKIRDQLKIKPGKKKTDLIDSILTTSSTQRSMTEFFSKGKAKAGTEQPKGQQERLREMVMQVLHKLVKIDEDVYNILLRVHIAYFRSTQLPTEVLPRPLRHLQRSYPEYTRTRADVWDDRETFIEYVDCLRAEAIIDGVLPSPFGDAELAMGKRKRPPPIKEEDEDEDEDKAKRKAKARAEAIRKATATKRLFDEVYPRWAQHASIKAQIQTQSDPVPPGLERFEPGYALTRAVHKSLKALEVLKDREGDSELDVLDLLLGQQHWCRGLLRGPWHIRKTSILAEKIKDSAASDALPATRAALTDSATGLIHRQPLIKTLATLQKALQVEDAVDIPELAKVSKAVVRATPVVTADKKKPARWKGRDGTVGAIETLVSQHYERKFDSVATAGGTLLTTLFTLLFWDIIFLPGDTFFPARQDAIVRRLAEIKAGRASALQLVKTHDAEYRARKVAAVGVRWDLCERKDLVGVVKAIPTNTLANICKMFCENYVEACLGAPDVVAWDSGGDGAHAYKLVHIQGPGYPNSASKKAWRDVLARAQEPDQEVCQVVDPTKPVRATKKGKGKGKKDGSDEDSDEEPGSDEDEDGAVAGRSRASRSGSSKASGSGSRTASASADTDEDEDDTYQPKNKTSKKRKVG
ncbi:hypothetical protein B0H14DRAFT_3787035 [Mycena olivaceomarginata]|nr:hypothetical protein B0H14DRAFT_3787035 [Mycena olivaceomarginata]